MSSNASAASGPPRRPARPGLGDVGGQQRLVAGAVEVDGVVRDARVADREGEAVQAGGELARDRLGHAADDRLLGGGQQHGDGLRWARRAARRASRGRSSARRARRRRARGRASRPRRARSGARARRRRRRPAPRSSPSSAPRATMSPRSVTSRRMTAARKRGLGGLRRAVGRAQALDLGGDQRGDDAQERGRRLAGPAAQPQPADHRVADPQLVHGHPGRVGHQRPLVGSWSARRRPARSSSGRSARARRRGRARRHGRPPAARGRTRPHRRWPRASRGRPPRGRVLGRRGHRAEV